MKTLLEETLEMAERTPIPVKRFCDAIGKTTQWYYQVRAGNIDPSVGAIQALRDYLRSKGE